MNGCAGCKFADWERTASGRLSPTGSGLCLWSKSVVLPISRSVLTEGAGRVLLQGARIWRNEEPYKSGPCRTFQPKPKGKPQ